MKIFKSGIPFAWPADRAMNFMKLAAVDPSFNFDDAADEAVHDAERYMDECMALGTAVHDTIHQNFDTGDKTPLPIDLGSGETVDDFIYNKMLDNTWKFIDKFHVVPLLVEAAMSCPQYAGTIDLLCEIDNEAYKTKRWCKKQGVSWPQPHKRVIALMDWKVAASFYDDMPVKLAAYKHMLIEYNWQPEVMLIGRFSKDTGSLNVKDYTAEYTDSFITFDLSCQLFHHNFKKFLKETEQEATRQRTAKIERKK
jgi:hypothetical protein